MHQVVVKLRQIQPLDPISSHGHNKFVYLFSCIKSYYDRYLPVFWLQEMCLRQKLQWFNRQIRNLNSTEAKVSHNLKLKGNQRPNSSYQTSQGTQIFPPEIGSVKKVANSELQVELQIYLSKVKTFGTSTQQICWMRQRGINGKKKNRICINLGKRIPVIPCMMNDTKDQVEPIYTQ